MLHENLKIARKNKGLTQEEVAIRLNVVRQTVSKWEKGASVPDADSVKRLAVLLDVSVQDLLGATLASSENEDEASIQREIAHQLSIQNELMAEELQRKRRFWHKVKLIIIVIVIGLVALILLNALVFSMLRVQPDKGVVVEDYQIIATGD